MRQARLVLTNGGDASRFVRRDQRSRGWPHPALAVRLFRRRRHREAPRATARRSLPRITARRRSRDEGGDRTRGHGRLASVRSGAGHRPPLLRRTRMSRSERRSARSVASFGDGRYRVRARVRHLDQRRLRARRMDTTVAREHGVARSRCFVRRLRTRAERRRSRASIRTSPSEPCATIPFETDGGRPLRVADRVQRARGGGRRRFPLSRRSHARPDERHRGRAKFFDAELVLSSSGRQRDRPDGLEGHAKPRSSAGCVGDGAALPDPRSAQRRADVPFVTSPRDRARR